MTEREHAMRRKKTYLLFTSLLLIGFLGGCATAPVNVPTFATPQPVAPPGPGYSVVVDNLLVLADVSRSMRCDGKIEVEKRVLSSFNSGIPQNLKFAGMRTFGKSAYDSTLLVQPMAPYDRAAFGREIDNLEAGCGNTPLAWALVKSQDDLKDVQGNIAILIVSDGENLLSDPIMPVLALKEQYGDRLCIHTIQVGMSEEGRSVLQLISEHSECGIVTTADQLKSADAMKKFITEVFYKQVYMDSDGDGVPDSLDKCPNTPQGVKVDANGCPLDSDRDGVPDYLDKCPNTPAGVQVDKNGCPLDSDGDGIPNYLDKCPDTPAGVKVDQNGCPLDSDGDGVPDYLDKCPNTPKGATVDKNGCWSIQGVTFEYNKAEIRPDARTILDQNVQVLKANPTMKVEIIGHTDSVGSARYNQALSERRAEAVKQYFESQGIASDRMTARGMGESQPIASNETPEGRAENRRVEIRILSK
jgi:outer membrane protein OmpA-like peptidoglycan-associated protein